ncbi:helix-turn-helix transcriptional regulator [Actinophytocola sp.]|jgi:transcriptional regulator with XRE-family HTH domain|uniref:helix-turn-helix domain-containing protein n=1 Tax=Actinophytocola sp. TaxID=1872138 RepID=UPI002D29B523|nr:helix-turn-helix transcriptional regulator [Actinophytocola sp.]HYQ69898.1 helix-turn-helix transcriptional regulator [Actinophytocola sp.]
MRERRLAQGLTQKEVVGRLARRGVHTTNRAISTMENGHALDLGLLPELAEALDCTVTYLLGLSSDPHSWRPDRPQLRPPNGAEVPHRPLRTEARTGLTANN